jgi:hypothetical protein
MLQNKRLDQDRKDSKEKICTLIPHFRACCFRPSCRIVPLLFLGKEALLRVGILEYTHIQTYSFGLYHFLLSELQESSTRPLRTRMRKKSRTLEEVEECGAGFALLCINLLHGYRTVPIGPSRKNLRSRTAQLFSTCRGKAYELHP